MTDTNTIIIGAGAAGLAVGAGLQRANVPFVILERTGLIGAAWRKHYDRLHLHTDKRLSALPHLPFPRHHPRYPARDQVVEYLEGYAHHFGLEPVFNQAVTSARRENDAWIVETATARYSAHNLVVATGYARVPVRPSWPDMDYFPGLVLHSSEYKNGLAFKDQRVLVVGFGNSGGEIALDLWEYGARPALCVRGPVNVVPRDVLGIPVLALAVVLSRLPTGLADSLSAPLVRLTVGDISRHGLRKLPYGPITQIKRDARIPLLDVGTMQQVRRGTIRIWPGIERFTTEGVQFVDGTRQAFDAVILATGYRPEVHDFLDGAVVLQGAVEEDGTPRSSGVRSAVPGLYFCGFYVAPTGMLRAINVEARQVAREIVQDYLAYHQ
ncbi:MAG: NAD(P)/FAD-dependent oxidoreductase [Chloroflexi bacterium]|nr:NAD(P)/FAD-dependent oxidoreductase [Chloroflexota bacterium]